MTLIIDFILVKQLDQLLLHSLVVCVLLGEIELLLVAMELILLIDAIEQSNLLGTLDDTRDLHWISTEEIEEL